MKSLPTLIRVHRQQLDEARRKLTDLETLLANLFAQVERLESELESEQASAGESDVGRYAYPNFAEAVIDRRETLGQSIAEIEVATDEARQEVAAIFDTVKTYELAEERDNARRLAAAERRERLRLDEVGLGIYRQRRGQSA